MSEWELIDSLRAAVATTPNDTVLRVHLAQLLIEAGDYDEARRHLGQVLVLDPGSELALALLLASEPGEDLAPDVDKSDMTSERVRASSTGKSLIGVSPTLSSPCSSRVSPRKRTRTYGI